MAIFFFVNRSPNSESQAQNAGNFYIFSAENPGAERVST